jgi:hypothetical protein
MQGQLQALTDSASGSPGCYFPEAKDALARALLLAIAGPEFFKVAMATDPLFLGYL